MKKLFSLILALCMVCTLVPAVAEEDVTGEWYLKTMKQGETEYDAGAISYNITMTLNADGTGTMLSPASEEPTPGSWTLEGDKITVTFEDSPIGGTVADGKITFAASCGSEAVAKGVKAGDLIRTVTALCGGKGGGKPDSAMGGGTDLGKLDEALAAVLAFVEEKTK